MTDRRRSPPPDAVGIRCLRQAAEYIEPEDWTVLERCVRVVTIAEFAAELIPR